MCVSVCVYIYIYIYIYTYIHTYVYYNLRQGLFQYKPLHTCHQWFIYCSNKRHPIMAKSTFCRTTSFCSCPSRCIMYCNYSSGIEYHLSHPAHTPSRGGPILQSLSARKQTCFLCHHRPTADYVPLHIPRCCYRCKGSSTSPLREEIKDVNLHQKHCTKINFDVPTANETCFDTNLN